MLRSPVHVTCSAGSKMVKSSIDDTFIYFESAADREDWLMDRVPSLTACGLLIVFCSTRGDAAQLANVVRARALPAACIHGETDQDDRQDLLKMFRGGEVPILVTTDVAARGLDIDDVTAVVNYGAAKSWEWHVHRVGRSGRAARKGQAYTLMLSSNQGDLSFAEQAVTLLKAEGRTVPPALQYLQGVRRSEQKRIAQQRRKRFKNVKPSRYSGRR